MALPSDKKKAERRGREKEKERKGKAHRTRGGASSDGPQVRRPSSAKRGAPEAPTAASVSRKKFCDCSDCRCGRAQAGGFERPPIGDFGSTSLFRGQRKKMAFVIRATPRPKNHASQLASLLRPGHYHCRTSGITGKTDQQTQGQTRCLRPATEINAVHRFLKGRGTRTWFRRKHRTAPQYGHRSFISKSLSAREELRARAPSAGGLSDREALATAGLRAH